VPEFERTHFTCSNSEAHVNAWALVFNGEMHIVYLDEFGHIGAYVARTDERYKTHPVFGLGGFSLPVEKVRGFGSFFQNLKNELLAWEIAQSGTHPGRWEKKGSSLLTTTNIDTYPEVGKAIKRILRRIKTDGGSVFYYGQVKPLGQTSETSRQRYDHVMIQSIKRLHRLPTDRFMIILDEVDTASRLDALASASGFMFGSRDGRKLVEPPMQVESHLYATVQCADWICALLGRITSYAVDDGFAEMGWASRMFGRNLAEVTMFGSKVHNPADTSRSLYPESFVPASISRPAPAGNPRVRTRTYRSSGTETTA
jgi:hypothetical protein